MTVIDETLITAVESTLDRVAHYLEVDDNMMADVSGGVVAVLLRAPSAAMLGSDLRWRRALTRWSQLKRRIGAPPPALADFVIDRARIFLVEAARSAGDIR
jgi:hypothetical protein